MGGGGSSTGYSACGVDIVCDCLFTRGEVLRVAIWFSGVFVDTIVNGFYSGVCRLPRVPGLCRFVRS